MPEVNTRHFGRVSCQDEAVLLFPLGLPAFEHAKRFVLIEKPSASPVVFLQSVAQADLCFLLLPMRIVDPDYKLALCAEDSDVLGLPEEGLSEAQAGLACFSILSLTKDRAPTANLLAPVVIDVNQRIGVQSVRLDSLYSHQHPLTDGVTRCS